MSERERIEWNRIKSEAGLRWLSHWASDTDYDAFTTRHEDRNGYRICLVGHEDSPDFMAHTGIWFATRELAERGEDILKEHCKVPAEPVT